MKLVFRDAREYFGSRIEDEFLCVRPKISDSNNDHANPARTFYVDSAAVSARLHFLGRITIERNKELHSLASKVLPEFSQRKRCRFCFGSVMPLSVIDINVLFGGVAKMPIHAIRKTSASDCKKRTKKQI